MKLRNIVGLAIFGAICYEAGCCGEYHYMRSKGEYYTKDDMKISYMQGQVAGIAEYKLNLKALQYIQETRGEDWAVGLDV